MQFELWKVVLYLSFQLAGIVFGILSLFARPSKIDLQKGVTKRLLRVLHFQRPFCWCGFPLLLAGSLLAFYFHADLLGQLLCVATLSIGLCFFLTGMTLYWEQSNNRTS